jgi:hypothetical protein
MAQGRRMGVVPWPGQQTVQARVRLGREGKALSRLISGLLTDIDRSWIIISCARQMPRGFLKPSKIPISPAFPRTPIAGSADLAR